MPPVREININNGIYIKLSGGSVFSQTAQEVQNRLSSYPGNLKKKETSYNTWLQGQEPFSKAYNWDDYDIDHLTHTDPNSLPSWRILNGAFVIEIVVWIAVHFYNDNPLSLTIKLQNKELGPITGEWWG